MRNMKSLYPNMPNQYSPQGVPRQQQAAAPFDYLKHDPMKGLALIKAFKRPVQQRVNKMRHLSDAMRGY